MLNIDNFVKITALTGHRTKINADSPLPADEVKMLIRLLEYTAHVRTHAEMKMGNDTEIGKKVNAEMLASLMKELDELLTAEGF